MTINRKKITDLNAGILLIGNRQWMGGITYIEMLFRAVHALPIAGRPGLSLVVTEQLLNGYRLYDAITDLADNIFFIGRNPKRAEQIIPQRFVIVDSINDLFSSCVLQAPDLADLSGFYPYIPVVPGVPGAIDDPGIQNDDVVVGGLQSRRKKEKKN